MEGSDLLTTFSMMLEDLKIIPPTLLGLQCWTRPFQSAVNMENVIMYL